MNSNPTAQTRAYTTEEAADKVRNRPATWRRNLCVNGHFMGIKPLAKLPNGRLLWPADKVDALISGTNGC
jgi:hypothetical protein